MSHLNKSALELALQTCTAEPIHQLGKVQSYGALLVLSADNRRTVLQVSDNINNFIELPVEGALGKQLDELVGEASALQVERLIAVANLHSTATGLIRASPQTKSVDLDAYVYGVNDMWVLEICQDKDLPKRDQLGELLMNMQNSMLAFAPNTESTTYFEQVTQLIRDLTGYDRVMMYRFHVNWDGEVIAESCVETATSYLGLRFPASDIPAQARLLYTKNLVRMVADITMISVSVFPEQNPVSKQPLDMTYSVLRSLSPIHIEYLRNMGVQASMSISLLQNGQLWGLIACHHLTPKRISFAMREAAVFISRMISTELTAMIMVSESTLYKKIASIKIEILKSLLTQSVEDTLNSLSVDLLDVIDASGMIVIVEGHYYIYGLVPEPLAIDALLNWLGKQTITEIYSCDNLSEHFPPASFYPEIVSGLIMIMLAHDRLNGIIWLRKEKQCTVKWAGLYEAGLVQHKDGTAQLNPRASFKIWSELWKGKSKVWSDSEIAIVQAFGASLSEALALKQSAKRVENERNEARDRLEKIASQLPGMVYQFYLHPDGSSSFPYASEGVKNIYRLAPDDICEDASKVFTLIHPDDLDELWASIQQSAQDLQPWKHEYRIKFDDGSIRWLYGNAMPTQERDINGGVLWHGFITDITERKLLEENLADSHTLNACILDSLTSHIAVVDNQGVIISVNKAWIDFGIENNLSKSLHNMYGSNYLDACHNCNDLPNGKEADQVHVGVIGVLTGILSSFTLEYPCNSPTQERWFILKVSPLKDTQGARCGAVISYDNITERKRMEDTLWLNNIALKKISQAVVISTPDQLVLYTNDAFQSMTGYSEAEAQKQNCRFLQGSLTNPQTINEIGLALKNFSQYAGEILNYRKDGTAFWNELTITPVFNKKNQLSNFVSTSRDITERKRLEQQDKEHLDQLAHVTRLGLMGEMASGIAHEVNQPLSAIATYAQASLNLIKKEKPDLIKLAEMVTKTQEQALRAGQIIHRMKRFCTSKSQQRSMADINELINNCINLCSDPLKQNNIQLTLELAENLPCVHIDSLQIEQVLINLIRNSIDAILSAPKKKQGQITIKSYLTPEKGVQISVKDNGLGIQKDQQSKILMPFHTTKENGMGMGLSISDSLIRAHDGALNFNSQLGVGSFFYFTLPIGMCTK